MRVLVAGASGVLGQPTVRKLLAAGHDVVGLVRDDRAESIVRELGAEPARGDVLVAAALAEAAQGIDAVVNLTGALPTSRDGNAARAKSEQVWRLGTEHLLSAAQRAGVQIFVQASLGLLYGEHGASWVTEDTPFVPAPRVEAALDAERLVKKAAEAGLPTVTLRLGTVYSRDAWHTRLLAQQARTRALAIVGDGRTYWSLIHADDAGQAIARAVDDAQAGAVYNVADDRPTQMADLLGLIARLSGGQQPSQVPALLARTLVGGDIVTLLTTSIRLSNRAIKQDLELSLRYPTPEEGLQTVLRKPLPAPD